MGSADGIHRGCAQKGSPLSLRRSDGRAESRRDGGGRTPALAFRSDRLRHVDRTATFRGGRRFRIRPADSQRHRRKLSVRAASARGFRRRRGARRDASGDDAVVRRAQLDSSRDADCRPHDAVGRAARVRYEARNAEQQGAADGAMAVSRRARTTRSSRGSIRKERAAPPGTRIEKDSLGERAVPADALYGIQTLRAVENLQFSGRLLANYPDYIRALATVKKAAARANRDARVIDSRQHDAIERAC